MVQSYNALLTMAHLLDVSDGIMLVQNDDLAATCRKAYNLPRPSFQV